MSTARPTRPPRAAPAIGLAAALAGLWARAQAPLPSVALRGGVSAVTPAPSPVVRVGAGTFVMGSDPAGLDQARTMCVRELERFAALEKEFAAQGVVFAVIADSRAERAAVEQMAAAAKATMPFGLDGQRKAPEPEGGMTAGAYGVARHLLPTTIVIDRSGKIRAAGVKTDKIKPLIEKFLAEEAR